MTSMNDRVVPPAARRRRRPTKTGVVLSEELIVETALRLLKEHGADALTVRRLGLALGADPTALYRYFRDTDDLLLAIADELIGRTLRTWRPAGTGAPTCGISACGCTPGRCRIRRPRCSAPTASPAGSTRSRPWKPSSACCAEPVSRTRTRCGSTTPSSTSPGLRRPRRGEPRASARRA